MRAPPTCKDYAGRAIRARTNVGCSRSIASDPRWPPLGPQPLKDRRAISGRAPSRSRPGDRRRRRGKSLRLCIGSHQAAICERAQQPVTCGPSRADLSLDFEHAHGGFDLMPSPSNSGKATIVRMRGLGEDEVARLAQPTPEGMRGFGARQDGAPNHMPRPAKSPAAAGAREVTRPCTLSLARPATLAMPAFALASSFHTATRHPSTKPAEIAEFGHGEHATPARVVGNCHQRVQCG
jgi:hypothetical protein